MAADLRNAKVAIFAFGMPGCPHCEEYLPRLEAAVQQAGQPFHPYGLGDSIVPEKIPVVILDASSTHPLIQTFADRLKVEAVPVSFIATRSGEIIRAEGSLTQDQIKALLLLARSHL